MAMNFQQRKDWVDFGKGLLMILLYVYHSEVIIGSQHSFSWWFAPFFLTGFFFLSGYLFQSAVQLLIGINNNIYIQSKELPNRFPFCFNICMIMSPFFLLGIIYRHFETSILIPNSWKFIGGCVVCYIGLMGLDSCFFDSHIVVVTNSYKNLPLIFIYAFVGILSLINIEKSK